ncbi:lipoprotein [Labrys sp. KB_33_2]|uniref:LPS translocon maturation chaperone LptM n=1 Tax=unclassified Labrys (in: a-proteobacteria) TaxID=2688601 RepID=UPI003EB93B44
MAGNAFRIALALTLVTTLGLAGCGRKGKLEPPPEQHVSDGKGGGYNKKKDPGYVKPDRKLPMDFLLN